MPRRKNIEDWMVLSVFFFGVVVLGAFWGAKSYSHFLKRNQPLLGSCRIMLLKRLEIPPTRRSSEFWFASSFSLKFQAGQPFLF